MFINQLKSNVQINNSVRTQKNILTELIKKMNALMLLIIEKQQQVQEQTSAFISNMFYISLNEQQQSLLSKIILNSVRQSLYGNAREN